jgi:hypothetical protein
MSQGRCPSDSFEMQRRPFGEDEIRYTQERIAEKYPACQVFYWYRSNEVWKKRRKPYMHTPHMGHPNSSSGFASGPPTQWITVIK